MRLLITLDTENAEWLKYYVEATGMSEKEIIEMALRFYRARTED